MQQTPLSDEERTLREQYIEQKCKLFMEAESLKGKIIHARLDIENANVRLREIESELWDNFQRLVDANEKMRHLDDSNDKMQVWHPGAELPENPDKDTIYLAIGLNGKPFLTHWWTEGIWLKSVVKWKYIDIPTNAPS